MCRMAAFLSTSPLRGYEVEDFINAVAEMASRGRTSKDTGMGHPHGWGAVAFREGRLLLYVRETQPIWRRGFYARFRADLMIIHARAASVGEVSFDNTHPFAALKGGKLWFLAHNGSIKGIEEEGTLGKTDTEALLLRILRSVDDVSLDSLAPVIGEIRDEFGEGISSMTLLMTSGGEIYALKGAREKPDYFNLYVSRRSGFIRVASQPLDGGHWEELGNWTLHLFTREGEKIVEESVSI